MKKFKEDNYQVGQFVIPGQQPREATHVVGILDQKPICKCEVNQRAIFQWTSFSVKDATCGNCQNSIKAFKKQAWKRY